MTRKRRTSAPKPGAKGSRRSGGKPSPVSGLDYDDHVPGSLFLESDAPPAGNEPEGAVDDAAGLDHEEDIVAEPAETGRRRT